MLLGVKEVNQYTYDVDDGSEYPHLRAAVEYGGDVARYDHDYGDPAQSVSAGSLIVTLNIGDLLPGLDQGVAHYNDGKRRGYGAEVDQKLSPGGLAAQGGRYDGGHYDAHGGSAVLVGLCKCLGQGAVLGHGLYRQRVQVLNHQHGGDEGQECGDGNQLGKPGHVGHRCPGSREHGDKAHTRILYQELGGYMTHGTDDHQQVQGYNDYQSYSHGLGNGAVRILYLAYHERYGNNGAVSNHGVGDSLYPAGLAHAAVKEVSIVAPVEVAVRQSDNAERQHGDNEQANQDVIELAGVSDLSEVEYDAEQYGGQREGDLKA